MSLSRKSSAGDITQGADISSLQDRHFSSSPADRGAAAAGSVAVAADSGAAAADSVAVVADSGAAAAGSVAVAADSGAAAADSVAVVADSGAAAADSVAVVADSGAAAADSVAVVADSGAAAADSVAVVADSGAAAADSVAVVADSGAAAADSVAAAPDSVATVIVSAVGESGFTQAWETPVCSGSRPSFSEIVSGCKTPHHYDMPSRDRCLVTPQPVLSEDFPTIEQSLSERMSQLNKEYPRYPSTESHTGSVSTSTSLQEEQTGGKSSLPQEVYNRMMMYNYIIFANLPVGVQYEQLKDHVQKMGPVFRMFKERNILHVTYLHEKAAIKAFNTQQELLGQRLLVLRPALESVCLNLGPLVPDTSMEGSASAVSVVRDVQQPINCQKSVSLFLGGLSADTSDGDIVRTLSKFGVVSSFQHPVNRHNGIPYCYCFVDIEATTAQKLLQQKYIYINNKKIQVEMARNQTQEPRDQPQPKRTNDDGGHKVFLRNLPSGTSYQDVREHFSHFGHVRNVYVNNRKGYVIFDSEDTLKMVVATTHTLQGVRINVSQSYTLPEQKLYLGGLPPNTSNCAIMQELSQYGRVLDMWRPPGHFPGQLAPFCFVAFEHERTAQLLLQQGSIIINGKKIDVKLSNRATRKQ
nr:uncharacterized protein LOC128701082 [Cherax quadricarinatus]XP_053650601.1 uncharacterized protein LOC128701082 [Cherax quadricarinatus]